MKEYLALLYRFSFWYLKKIWNLFWFSFYYPYQGGKSNRTILAKFDRWNIKAISFGKCSIKLANLVDSVREKLTKSSEVWFLRIKTLWVISNNSFNGFKLILIRRERRQLFWFRQNFNCRARGLIIETIRVFLRMKMEIWL